MITDGYLVVDTDPNNYSPPDAVRIPPEAREAYARVDWSPSLCKRFPPSWWLDNLFAEGRRLSVSAEIARSICAVCPIREGCLNYALDYEGQPSIWGGLTHRERVKLRGGREYTGAYNREGTTGSFPDRS